MANHKSDATEMRSVLGEWAPELGLTDRDIPRLPADEIVRLVATHYPGGLEGWDRDSRAGRRR